MLRTFNVIALAMFIIFIWQFGWEKHEQRRLDGDWHHKSGPNSIEFIRIDQAGSYLYINDLREGRHSEPENYVPITMHKYENKAIFSSQKRHKDGSIEYNILFSLMELGPGEVIITSVDDFTVCPNKCLGYDFPEGAVFIRR